MSAVAILSLLIVATTVGAEFLRRIVESRLLDRLTDDVAQSVDQLSFISWDDLKQWYERHGRELISTEGLELEPLEGYTVLKAVENRLQLGSDSDTNRKRAVISNALETLPTTFDCYRFYGSGRALITAITGFVVVFEQASQIVTVATIITLSIILLTTLPMAALSTIAIMRVLRYH